MIGLIILLLTATMTTASQLAGHIPQNLEGRSAASAGGWALVLNPTASCPADTASCGLTWCCPSSLTCVNGIDNGAIDQGCCPGADQCLSSLISTPLCADTTWTLWNITQGTDEVSFFCCLPGQVGLQTGGCVPNSGTLPPLASLISSAPQTTTTSSSTVNGTSPTTTSSGHGGLGSLISTGISKATGHTQKSASTRLVALELCSLVGGIAGIFLFLE